MSVRDDAAPALLSFLIGGIVGASLTCLLAPQSGTALRRRIRRAVERGARTGRAAANGASQRLARRVPEPGLPTDMGGGGRG
jgi:gas vesicle protein